MLHTFFGEPVVKYVSAHFCQRFTEVGTADVIFPTGSEKLSDLPGITQLVSEEVFKPKLS